MGKIHAVDLRLHDIGLAQVEQRGGLARLDTFNPTTGEASFRTYTERDGLPNATWTVFEKSGHFAPVEEPEAFRTAVFDFLMAHDPALREIAVTEDPETGEAVSRYFDLPEKPEAVAERFELVSAACRYADGALPFVKDVGSDILNGLTAVARAAAQAVAPAAGPT